MRGTNLSKSPTRVLAFVAVIAAFGTAAAPAHAVTKTLTYSCTWPGIGAQDLTVAYDAAIAAISPVGRPTGETPVNVRILGKGDTGISAQVVGAVSLEGRLTADAQISGPGVLETKPLVVDLSRTVVPGSGDVPFDGSGAFGSVTFAAPGATSIGVDAPLLTMVAFGSDGRPIVIDPEFLGVPQIDADPKTFEVPCGPKSTSQDSTLATGTAAQSDDFTAPAAPGKPIAASVTHRGASISWPLSVEADVLSYEVTYVSGLGTSATRVASGASALLTGLAASTTYEVSVRARDAAGNWSPASATTVLTTSSAPVGGTGPTTPELFPDAATDTLVNLYWRTSTDDTGVAKYDVLQDGVKVGEVVGANHYTFRNLTPATSYEFQVIAYDLDGNATPGNKLTVRTGVAGGGVVPKPVAYVTATPLSTSLAASWYGAEDDGPLRYEVSLNGAVVTTTSQLNYKFQALTPDTEYEIGVRAVDSAGNFSTMVTDRWRTKPIVTPTPTPTPVAPTSTGPVATPKLLNYTCQVPGAGNAPVSVEYGAVQRGTSAHWDVTATVVVTPELAGTLATRGTASVGGKISAKTTFWGPNGAKTQVPVAFALPKQSAGSRWTTSTTVVGPVALGDGPVAWTVDLADLNLGLLDFLGNPIVVPVDSDPDANPNTLDLPCQPTQAGQDMRIKQLVVSGGGTTVSDATPPVTCATATDASVVDYGYALTGSATLKTLAKGSLPLTGSIAAKLGAPSGCFSGDLLLNKTSGNLVALGFLPVTAQVQIVATEKVTGQLAGGVLKANAKVRIKLPKVTMFGLQIGGGSSCQAKQVSSIALKSAQPVFLPLSGGPIVGTFTISDLSGCGALTGIISPLTAGKGNAIQLNLAPKP